jgi:hypothetical protein
MQRANPLARPVVRLHQLPLPRKCVHSQTGRNLQLPLPTLPERQWTKPLLQLQHMPEHNQKVTLHQVEEDRVQVIHKTNAYRNNRSSHPHHSMFPMIHRRSPTSVLNSQQLSMGNKSHHSPTLNNHRFSLSSHHPFSHHRNNRDNK